MELAGVVWDVAKCLWGCSKGHTLHVCGLQDNLESLRSKGNELQTICTDLNRRINEAEDTAEKQRTEQVSIWLQKVHHTQQVIEDIQVQGTHEIQNKCLCKCCPKNCVASYKLGKSVVKMLLAVDELITMGESLGKVVDIAYRLPGKPMNEMPIDETVGMDFMLNKVWDSIEAEAAGIIGLYGMGGAGKTTLMKRINNEFGKRRNDFDVVLWLVVSKDPDIDKIMDNIRRKLHVPNDIWNEKSKEERVAKIYEVLKKRKFCLLLDDIWNKLDLTMLGVPHPKDNNYKSKVIFTTRSEDVCAKMQAKKKFKVECLTEKDAFDLFCMKVGEETLNSHCDIPKLAREMATKCDGLPLALITVGSAMAGVKSVESWEHAKKFLTSCPLTAPDLEKDVFSILKFSYDKLPDEAHRICFLYCALYPEDYEIQVDDLIDRWIAEGFLGKDKSIHDMYSHGKIIIERLKLSCLLECVDDFMFSLNGAIKMHDVIRDMALWLARDQDRTINKILVEGEALPMSQMTDAETWNTVERISIMDIGEWKLPPTCPNLLTLVVLNASKLTSLPKCMSNLKVLHLERCSMIPKEVGQFIHLEYLNLFRSNISMLPMELKNLKNLRVLLLEHACCGIEFIPLEVMSSLTQLRVFRHYKNEYGNHSQETARKESLYLEELESLPALAELCLQIRTDTGMKKLLESSKLKNCVRSFRLCGHRHIGRAFTLPSFIEAMSEMNHLESIDLFRLDVKGVSILNTCHFWKLRKAWINFCHSIIDLNWLRYAPLIEILWIHSCSSLKEVTKEGTEDNIFSRLVTLILGDLPKLNCIHERALPFPSLKLIRILNCPYLKKLPLDSSSARNSLIEIHGEKEWWDKLEWQDPLIKDIFQSKYRNALYHVEKGTSSYRNSM